MRCRFCGNEIRREQRAWATSDPNLDHPWYCTSNPDGHRHQPELASDGHEVEYLVPKSRIPRN